MAARFTWFNTRKLNLCVQAMSEQYLDVWGFFFFCAEGACAEAKIFSEKRNFVRHFAGFNFSRLSLAFILKYYPILHVVKR